MLGSYAEVVAHRAGVRVHGADDLLPLFFFWRCGGMMLLGMALYKWGFLDGRRPDRDYADRGGDVPSRWAWRWRGTARWRSSASRFAMPRPHDRRSLELRRRGLRVASGTRPCLSWSSSAACSPGCAAALAAVGQMAFSNYLFQSVVTSVMFLGWGLGLAGRLDYARAAHRRRGHLGRASSCSARSGCARYRFGPAEWLWRSLTYWQRQPMRRETPPSPRPGPLPAGV